MALSVWHIGGILLAFVSVFGAVLRTTRQKSVDGFSVGGRAANAYLVAGALVGTIIGGAATIGTTQSAVSSGFSALWFTVGAALGFLILGAVYAGPLRRSGLKTIAEYMLVHYGKGAAIATSLVSVLGIFFSLVASGIAGMHFLQLLFAASEWVAALLLLVLVVLYVLLGGIKGTAVSGIIKTGLLFGVLCIGGIIARHGIAALPNGGDLLSWSSLSGAAAWSAGKSFATNCLSVIIGVVVTQSYAQAIYSAADTDTAKRGTFLAALICLPVGIPLVLIGIYMQQTVPNLDAVTALPLFMQMHLPDLLGGLGIGAVLLSIIGSLAGLSLGAATSLTVDVAEHGLGINNPAHLFYILQGSLVLVVAAAFSAAFYHYDSQVLYWNFLSFSLRGAGIFFPFLCAMYQCGNFSDRSIAAGIYLATGIAIASIGRLPLPVNPLYVGMGCSVLWLMGDWLRRRM